MHASSNRSLAPIVALLMMSLPLLTACGGAPGLPPPPPFTPVDSPEPQTQCTAQRDAAKKAREDVLEFGTVEYRDRAAAAVLAHADCERKQLDSIPVHDATQKEMIANIRRARLQYLTAANLYQEVVSYKMLRYVRALAGRGAVHAAFARKLQTAPAPGELRRPKERKRFTDELKQLAIPFRRDAVTDYSAALDQAQTVGQNLADPDRLGWIPRACKALASLGASATDRPVCRRR